MHNELNKAKISNQYFNNKICLDVLEKYFENYSRYFKNNFQSIISDIFYGLYDSRIIWNNCNKLNHNIKYFNILRIPPDEVQNYKKRAEKYITIIDCIEYYQKNFVEDIYCNNCQKVVKGSYNCILLKYPKVIIIDLKNNNETNVDIKINFEEIINIQDLFYSKDNIKYKLIGVISKYYQYGLSIQFIAFCKSFINNNWYKYNDSIVSLSFFKDIKRVRKPSLFFYSSE